MENHLKSIQAHLSEVAAAAANLTREASGYMERIKELKPVAESLEAVVKQVAEKRAELDQIETKLVSARKSLKDIKDSLK